MKHLVLYFAALVGGSSIVSETSENVRFLVATRNDVRLYNSNNLNSFDYIALSLLDLGVTVDYHYAKNIVFIYSKDKLYKTTMEPKRLVEQELTPALVKNVSLCNGFAVDWVHDKIYWADCTNYTTSVAVMDLDGGNVNHLMKRPYAYGLMNRMEVDPYKGIIFWIAGDIIESCDLSGDNFKTKLSLAGVVVRAFTLDLTVRRVYYVGWANMSASLYSMNYDGQATREHFKIPQVQTVRSLGYLRGRLYWTNYDLINTVVYTARPTLNRTGDIQMMLNISMSHEVEHMKIVHHDLQEKPNYNPCDVKMCSHICVIESAISATCHCNEDQELDSDGITCISDVKIKTRTQWGAASPKETPTLISEAVPLVIIHHSEGNNGCSGKPCEEIVRNIQHFHMSERQWADIGYNFLVAPTGDVFEGRGWGVVGAHALNYNRKSVGICLIGNYTNITPPDVQLQAAQKLISAGVNQGKIKSSYKLVGHRQVRATSCPGDRLYSIIQQWPHFTSHPEE